MVQRHPAREVQTDHHRHQSACPTSRVTLQFQLDPIPLQKRIEDSCVLAKCLENIANAERLFDAPIPQEVLSADTVAVLNQVCIENTVRRCENGQTNHNGGKANPNSAPSGRSNHRSLAEGLTFMEVYSCIQGQLFGYFIVKGIGSRSSSEGIAVIV